MGSLRTRVDGRAPSVRARGSGKAGGYVPLWVKTYHSFLAAASSPEELVERAHALGLGAIAITDLHGVYGLVRAHVRGVALGVRVLAGAEVCIEDDGGHTVLLAQDRAGYAALCHLLSRGHARGDKGEALVRVPEVAEHLDGLVALSDSAAVLRALHALRGPERLHALCARHLEAEDRGRERQLRQLAGALGMGAVGVVEVLYHDRARRALHDVLRCIHHGCTLSEVGRRIRANDEHALLGVEAMRARFADAPELLDATLALAERCAFGLGELDYRYPCEADSSDQDGERAEAMLRARTYEGARARYGGGIPRDVRAQLDKELALIRSLRYGGYFLTMHEIVRFCRSQNILCQGRGSAANSAVCYCLGITAIDPVRMDFLFERFLSRERAEPPDIDLDIEHGRREEVIQHVYRTYGRDHAAMVANVIRYRARSAVRDVGKALGVPAGSLDAAARLLRHRRHDLDPRLLAEAGLKADAPATQRLCALTEELLGVPRHLSIHPGGFLLGRDPVHSLVPIEPATMPGRTVIQWDKYDVEALALFKVDLLGLGALTCIHHAFDLLKAHHGRSYAIATVPAEDPDTYRMISRGDTAGLFQIESRAQMAMLPRLRPATFYDLVIEVAIVRPGPIQGDMVHPYLRRREGSEPTTYPHPSLERVLHKTLGVPIFQEQVMKLAVLAADYTPGEADQLRRDMAAWNKHGRIEAHHDRIVERMVAHGVAEEFAERTFAQIRGFGEYGFPESHAASFALLAYVTAWLKCHHPDVFLCAMLNAQPMGFYAPSTLIEDARRHGVEVRPICVQRSAWECTLEARGDTHGRGVAVADRVRDGGDAGEGAWGARTPVARVESDGDDAGDGRHDAPQQAVRMGLRYVRGLGERERASLERPGPPYASLEAFVRTTGLSERHLLALAEAGALDALVPGRRAALWASRAEARFWAHAAGVLPSAHEATSEGREPVAQLALPLHVPEARACFAPLDRFEQVRWDYRASDHSTRGHPMAALRAALSAQGVPDARTIRGLRDGARVDYVGVVICRQRPHTASGVTFLTLEDETGFVNAVLWERVFERYARLAKTAVLLGLRGKLQVVSGVTHLIAERLFEPTFLPTEKLAGAQPRSRDFH